VLLNTEADRALSHSPLAMYDACIVSCGWSFPMVKAIKAIYS